ncbi:MAG: response regulator [Oscillibacter sp.]|nr:response regulator [Oscillibacter sp.]
MDILFENGTIRTLERNSPDAQALLVRNGRIAAVGGRTAVEDQTGIDVRRVDLAGRTLLPAFLDAHSHFTAVANQFLQVSLEGCTSWADMQDRIRDYIRRERIPAGQWVTAQGYDHNLLSERRHPDRLCLDAAAPDNPVVICHQSGHMGVFNTAALERLGVTAQTPAPAGGVIGRENGTLTGYMEENAFLEFQKRVPMRPLESFLAAYRKAQDLYASYGITTVQEGLLRRELVPLYQALLADGSLKLDVVAYGDPEGAEAARQAFPESVRQYHRRFKLGGYKMFLDGSPQGRTAWLRRPYQGEQEYRGYGTLTDAEVLDMVRRAGTDGMQLLAHCNGDAACAQYLAALDAAAREGVDLAALRPVMIHAQLLGRDQLPEVRRLGVIPSFFVAHVYHWGDVHLENLGPGRAEAISPAGSAAEQGIPFTFHQDAPVIRPDMLETVWCAVNRVTRQGRVLGREERVDVRTALEAVTVHAAYQYFEETDKGTLAPGKQADLVILDRMLPSMDGITVLQEARKNHVSTPVIMLTALGELQDKLTGLKGGADDYMVKPFAFEELLARIQCMVRRPGRWENTAVLSLGDLIFDPESGRLEGNGKECTLSKREGALLELMLRNAGQTLPREVILNRVWGADSEVEDGNLDNYIHFLRRRLKSVRSTLNLKTVRGIGYRLEN